MAVLADELDASFALPDPAAVKAQGFGGVRVYLGSARPSQAWVDECRSLGLRIRWVQETTGDRALEGWNAGIIDAQTADARATERGAAGDDLIVFVISDGSSSNPSEGADAMADYGAAVATQEARPFEMYGNRYAVDAATAGARRVSVNVYGYPPALHAGPNRDGGWLPRTWDYDPTRDSACQEIGYYTDAGGVCDRNTGIVATGAPAPAPTPTRGYGMDILRDYDTPGGRCALFQGNLKGRDFTGVPDPTYGIPADAIAYAAGRPIIFAVSKAEYDFALIASTNLLTAPGTPGEPAPPFDTAPIVAALSTASTQLGAGVDAINQAIELLQAG